jgi:WD40 repeat protein
VDTFPPSGGRDAAPSENPPSIPPVHTWTKSGYPGHAAPGVLSSPSGQFALGQMLGNRYRITRLLGRGGMGEVWVAYDLKLQVEVALKALMPGRFAGDEGLELLRNEVRSAREVISPNVCRIFDLVEEDGREFVSMEYVDGGTLLALLRERAPLPIPEATRIAAQFLAGLDAIHHAGLVHRDVKPENIMITRTGRALLMDFGIAKGVTEDRLGTIAGTPAYMSPEQLRGEAIDARADIFAAGVTLAEMIAPAGLRDHTTRQHVWDAVRNQPLQLFDSPWRRLLERAVAVRASDRYSSAGELARALEEVPQRIEGAEDKQPYPGLAAFTEADAEFFFGRELDVEATWKKLQRTSLLAIIGASGVGKTSFLRAGLVAAMPEGWHQIAIRPGAAPFAALGQALGPELEGDLAATPALAQLDDWKQASLACGRWRAKYGQVLLICDQFEELFTLCRPEVQAGFANLLGRLATEVDVHVLLSMRDDFLLRCHEHPRLAPIASNLTMLGAPSGSALRRALVQPALLCGYRFEDESLAEEMLDAVAGERGALPLVAFAAARLWQSRDRDRGLLTRAAYESIGGVTGALAQHAEATLERIGPEREGLVREIFRNLVTADGTRAATEVEELLSVFGDREEASEVLQELLAARLLTTFETETEGGRQRRCVEVVHESLLAKWPRLVRWQAQDAASAQFRDQLRQQARLWEDRGRPDDLLWGGSSYREFASWRERYSGGLTVTEGAFTQAMAGRAGRERRRRRRMIGGVFAALVLVAVGVTGLWVRAEVAQRRSEASKLLALGRNELDANPSAALAYAVASLELADNPSARRFAIESLSRGPSAVLAKLRGVPGAACALYIDFSPDGKRLAIGGSHGVQVYSRDGSAKVILSAAVSLSVAMQRPQFAPDGDRVIFTANDNPTVVRVWSLSAGREVRSFPMEGATLPLVRGGKLFMITDLAGSDAGIGILAYPADARERTGKWTRAAVRVWAFGESEPEMLGAWNPDGIPDFDIDSQGRWVAYPKGRGVYLVPLAGLARRAALQVGEHPHEAVRVRFDPSGEHLASSDASGEIRLWAAIAGQERPLRVITGKEPLCGLWFSPTGTTLAAAYASTDKDVRLWDLDGLQDAEPRVLRRGQTSYYPAVAFDPTGRWIAVTYHQDIAFWPLVHALPYVLHGNGASGGRVVAFSQGSQSLAAALYQGGIRIWSLTGGPTRDLWKPTSGLECIALDPQGRFVVAGTRDDGAYRVSLADGRAQRLAGGPRGGWVSYLAISPEGRRVAGIVLEGPTTTIRVWDLETGTSRVLERSEYAEDVSFDGRGRVYAGSLDSGEIRRWDLAERTSSVLLKWHPGVFRVIPVRDGRILYSANVVDTTVSSNNLTIDLVRHDLEHHVSRPITTHGNRVAYFALDSAATYLATGDFDGATRVGPATGEEPHLLLPLERVDQPGLGISPDGRWVAVSDNKSPTVYLWHRPEGQPLQALPRRDFLQRLRLHTYLRVIPDRTSTTGYRLDDGPYSGWEEVPDW